MKPELVSTYTNSPDAFWMKGNLHTHTTRSDGRQDPQHVINHYSQLGYDFLALSDHDTLSDYSNVDNCGMVLISANEICGGAEHLLHIGADKHITRKGDTQSVLDELAGEKGFAVLCHPNWTRNFNHYSYELLNDLQGHVGIEIYNGLVEFHPGNADSTDKWDRLLATGKLIWGFANDDTHTIERSHIGWNVVQVAERTPEAILEALRRGRFYASSGVVINHITCNGLTVNIRTSNAERIAVYSDNGKLEHFVDSNELTYDASSINASLIRIQCLGPGATKAWTQPFLIRGGLIDEVKANFARLSNTFKAPIVESLPQMTGKLDDLLWSKTTAVTSLLNMEDASSPSVNTEIRCLAAHDKLIIGLKCDEPDLEAIKVESDHDGSQTIWSDDSIEIFISPTGKTSGYFHMMANANGFATVTPYGEIDLPIPSVKTASGRYDSGWSIEIAVSMGDSELIKIGKEWLLHFCRNRTATGETLVSSNIGDSNHRPECFGKLAFIQ